MPDDFEQTNRRAAYACDIISTNSEFGFDYLRDNMAVELAQTVQRGHWYAIVDEVDSILMTEARTPLHRLGQPASQGTNTYYAFARAVGDLEVGVDYEVDEKFHTAAPTEEGVDKVEKAIGVETFAPRRASWWTRLIQRDQGQGALQARRRVHRDGR